MEKNLSVSIVRLDKANHNTGLSISVYNRLLWRVIGEEIFFVPSGSEFDMGKFSGPGWILEFSQNFAVDYVERYPDVYNHVLVTNTALGQISLPLPVHLRSEMNDLALLLHHAQAKGQSELYLQAYADLIFLNANQLYAKQNL